MANQAQCDRGAVKTAKQLGISALPPDTRFECELREVFRWSNEAAEMQRNVEAVWRTIDIIDGKRYALPADSKRGLYIEMLSNAA
jgi:hypothetical protein